MKLAHLGLCAGLSLALTSTSALAGMAVGLVGDKTLVVVDADKPAVVRTMNVDGVGRLLGIDVRPSNGMLYGVAADGSVVTIDTRSGKASKVSKLEMMLPADVAAIVDFNPVADKLRFMGTDGTNLRADVETGKVTKDGSLAFEAGDMHAGETPSIVAAAYSNSFGKPEKTAMYDVDSKIVALIHQTKPNDGTLKAIGKLGVPAGNSWAFDIQTGADGKNTAWLVGDNTLHWVALDTGKASTVGMIAGVKGAIRDIAVLPKS